jgi:ABC-type nitrate/sulfonate/bicarbonate transport system permease component
MGLAARGGDARARGERIDVKRRHAAEGLILPLVVLAAWQIGARFDLVPHYLSSPVAIAAEFGRQLQSPDFFANVGASLLRAYVGFVLGASVGIGLGLAAGVFVAVRNFFDPLIAFLYPIPKIAFLPIFFILFGLGHGSQIAPIFLTVFFPVFIAARYAVQSLNKIYVWAARNMGAGRLTLFLRVVVPDSLPGLFTGLRVGLAHSFVVLFAAELIGARSGLGYFILDAENAVRFDRMMVGIIAFGILGFGSDRILMAVRRRLLRGQAIGTAERARLT